MRENIAVLFLTSFLVWQGCFKFRTSDAEAIEKARQAGTQLSFHTFEFNKKCSIHYARSGHPQLPLLFFIHGSPGAWDAFEKYLNDSLLQQHFQMISVDRPGFGYSNFGKAMQMDAQDDLFAAMIDSLRNQRKVYLAGHSLGGPMVADLAARYPTLVDGIVILAGSVDPGEEKGEAWRNLFLHAPLRYLLPGAFRPSNDELVWFKESVQAMPQLLQKIQCPVAIVHGTKDMFVPYENALYAQQHLQKASQVYLATIEGANHFIPWTHFEDIRKLILQFESLPLHNE